VNEKVRVLHILPSVRGYGAERLIVELLKYLPSDELEAELLTIYEPPPEARATLPFAIFNAGRKGRRDRLFICRLVREIRRCNPDVVHTHTHVGKYWGRVAALLAGARRIVHTEHNPCDFRRTALERIADWMLHRATDRVVTFFREQGTALVERESLPSRKLVLIPNGLALPEPSTNRASARARLGVDSDELVVMTVGRMEYQKNHILALRSFALLPERVQKRTGLFFAGSGKEEVVLRGLSIALQIGDRVRFLGYRNDVPDLLPGVDLLLMTSWFEGMPLTLLEAMLAGVPIVSTPWLGARNMLGDGRYGFLTPSFEPVHVAAEIERALEHPNLRVQIAERARRHVVGAYDIRQMADAHRRMYLELCGAAS
jgi:glycosyltransferase involved in cell wall biosynthesis